MTRGARRLGSILLPCLLASALACDAGDPATGPGADAPAIRVGPGVAESLARGEGARVMIALDPSSLAGLAGSPQPAGGAGASGTAGGVDIRRLERAVSELADGFLARVGAAGLDGIRRFSAVPAVAATVADEAALERVAADPAVVRIDLDVGGHGGLGSSVAQVGADRRHARGNDGEGVTVAVLDTGVDTDHVALAGRIVHQACFGGRNDGGSGGFCPDGGDRQTGAGAAEDDAGHGTHVTGVVASNGAVGAPGVAPGASIVSLKVMDNCDFSGCFYAFSEIVAALDYLIVNQDSLNVRAVSMSLGTGVLFDGDCDQTTAFNTAGSQAINTLRAMGVLAFAASMNNGSPSQMASPACLRNVIAVAAVNAADELALFSNVNASTDLAAPGVEITSLARGGGTRVASGTSMAAPHAAGCAALLFQASPSLEAAAIAARLRTSPVQVPDSRNGVTLPRLSCLPDAGPPDPRTTVTVDRPGGP